MDKQSIDRSARHAEPTTAIARECARFSTSEGIVAALRFLNERAHYRFTGIYQADPPVLRNIVLFDRENPFMNVSGSLAPLEETYCAVTYATHRPFVTNDAGSDVRLLKHAARNSVISYAGVPIRRPDGTVWGSLCHHDIRPRLLPTDELEILESVVPVLITALGVYQPS